MKRSSRLTAGRLFFKQPNRTVLISPHYAPIKICRLLVDAVCAWSKWKVCGISDSLYHTRRRGYGNSHRNTSTPISASRNFYMLLSEHPLSCLVCPEKSNCTECMSTIRKGGMTTGCGSCPKDQQCELQTMAKRLGVDDIRLPVKYRMYPVEKFDPFYDRDYNLCILCGRCV